MKFWPLIWRNLTRNRLRSLLTAGAIALSIALVCLLRTMPEGMDAIVEQFASNARISIHNDAGLVYPLPGSYLQKVRAVSGVVAATSWTWFGGAVDATKGVTFPNFAVDPESVGTVYADYRIEPAQLEDFLRYRDGAIVGSEILKRQRWKVGDVIGLVGTDVPLDLSFRIVGEIPGAQTSLFWFRRDYLEQALRAAGTPFDAIGMIWARIDDPGRVEGAMREIDAMFRNSDAEVSVATEKSFFGSFYGNLRGLLAVILVVTALVALSIVFVAANTASISIRERAGGVTDTLRQVF